MHENLLATAARLSNDALVARLKLLSVRERDATVEIVAHLAELDARKTHLGEGPGSLFVYCRDVLGYSEDAAWNRAATAAAVRRYPVILGWLADASLNVTTVRMLRSVLTPESHLAVLTEARRRSKKDVERIVARLDPKPDVPSTIRKLPVPAPVATPTLLQAKDRPAPLLGPPPAPVHRPVIAPLAPERYRLQFTVSKETHDKLRRVQDLLCREIPDGDPAAIFDRALDLLAREVEKKKLAATTKPRAPRETKPGSRDIPAHVRRAVWKRDGGQCAFEGRSGRCDMRRYLEWHHIRPFGHQGPATVDNVSLRCRAHNVYESEQVFGRFDPAVAREAPETYAVSREFEPFRNGASAGTHLD
jgi:5-methylcytosine-specific restriction endonuclease McrA